MSFWNKIKGTINGAQSREAHSLEVSKDASRYAFVDVEIGLKDNKIHDIGALRWDGAIYHSASNQGQSQG